MNFLLPLDSVVRKLGFYTTRFITSANPEEAKVLAIESVLTHPDLLNSVVIDQQTPPIIDIEEVDEISLSDASADTGLAFYVDEEFHWAEIRRS